VHTYPSFPALAFSLLSNLAWLVAWLFHHPCSNWCHVIIIISLLLSDANVSSLSLTAPILTTTTAVAALAHYGGAASASALAVCRTTPPDGVLRHTAGKIILPSYTMSDVGRFLSRQHALI
jgi:hypothetical protein